VLVALALAACASATGSPAARVGDAEISTERLDADVVAFAFLSGLNGGPCGTPIEGESQESACVRLTLTNEIREEVVKAYALEHGLSVDEADVRDAIAQLEDGLGGAAALDDKLAQGGMDREGLRSLADRLLLFNVVQNAVTADRLDEESLRGLYESSLQQLTSVEVAHILLPTREEAEQVAAEATPENFAKLARQRSTDSASASNGGSLGTFSEAQFRQQFDPTFVDAALALEPGEISGVVETSFGFHVIELIRRDVAPFEQVRDQLSAQQAPQVFQSWLEERYRALDVEVNPRFGRLDDTGQVVPVRSTEASPSAAGATGPTSTAP
jgi:foldase protein PrsA